MIDGTTIRNKKIEQVNLRIKNQPLYRELFSFLNIDIQEDIMQAEILIEQIVIGMDYVKISEPTVELLDFFKNKQFSLHSILPAYESENYRNPVTAWLVKN